MSREIEFRAWDKENECWLNFGYTNVEVIGNIHENPELLEMKNDN